ncbi:MAG: haloacid dehalogenase-like hydrolase [Pirellulales bacterium]|nr:haloacid dehalogenase-like hydrolase [Pirellulales bacterium]
MRLHTCVVATIVLLASFASVHAADPLPSWNEGAAKKSLTDFVARVTDERGEDYVPLEARIATFDNDGTLWVEKPVYTQFVFMADRVKKLAPKHLEWRTRQPFAALLAGDMKKVGSFGAKGMLDIAMATHAGMTDAEFETLVVEWITTAKHPRFKRLYTELVYQPQLELLKYLRDNGFKTFIVSGGGIDFMRPWTRRVYGIPRAQVVGSSIVTEFQIQDGKPVLMRLPKINFIDDKAGKPVGIGQHIGRRPILAFGNSDGDLEMLQYTTGGSGARLGLIVHHTDAKREYAYDRDSTVGKLDKAWDLAPKNGWVIVDMKSDWNRIFPWEAAE